MEVERAEELVRQGLESYLNTRGITPKKGKLFRCLNPKHNDSTPSMEYRIESGVPRCHCYGKCKESYGTFDLIAFDMGLDPDDSKNYTAIRKRAFELFHLTVSPEEWREYYNKRGMTSQRKAVKKNTTQSVKSNTDNTIHNTQQAIQKEEPRDYSALVEPGYKALLAAEKPMKYVRETRGISAEIIEQYKISYAPKGYNSFFNGYSDLKTGSSKEKYYRLFFPFINEAGKVTYILSEIADRKQMDDYNQRYRKLKGIPAQIFNERYLKKDTPQIIFVTEGIYDALSVETAGGKAISLGGLSENRFLKLLDEYKPQTKFILALDNDESGHKGAAEIAAALDKRGYSYQDISSGIVGKDMNEYLQKDRDGFIAFVGRVMDTDSEEREQYLRTSAEHRCMEFIEMLENPVGKSFYSTGFSSLDSIMDGGLYAGLYCLGAITSLGKTTFCLQICDNIAKSGTDCLIFTMEMSTKELMAKSISRLSVEISEEEFDGRMYAKTTRGILTPEKIAEYNQNDKTVYNLSVIRYATEYAPHIYFHEGIGDIGVMDIRRAIEKHIRLTGRKPVVLVDYLQILSPYSDKLTDKQNVDKTILELKRTSRDYDIPIIGVSSFNRDNYTEPVNLASFKESGAVEYGSDMLIGLQFEGMDYDDNEGETARKKRVRTLIKEQYALGRAGEAQNIQVKVLKQRNGGRGDSINLSFYPRFNRFEERTPEEQEAWEEEGIRENVPC